MLDADDGVAAQRNPFGYENAASLGSSSLLERAFSFRKGQFTRRGVSQIGDIANLMVSVSVKFAVHKLSNLVNSHGGLKRERWHRFPDFLKGIDWRFARRACFPPAMHPKPLFGITSDILLQ